MDLRAAQSTAKAYFVEHDDSFSGFSPEAATELDPSIKWSGDQTAQGTVTIVQAEGADLLLVARVEVGIRYEDAYYCVALMGDGEYQLGVAQSQPSEVGDCVGDEWPEIAE